MKLDVITVGRANMDLYSRDHGAPFEEIQSFDAMVGGSPTNIAIGTSRLGLRAAAFTAVGDDRVGRFVLRNLDDEGVDTSFIPVKAGKLTSLALLGSQPPSQFPLSFYREDAADLHLTVDDAAALPIGDTRVLLLSGDAFARGSCADAARWCAESARQHPTITMLDLDLRPSTWEHPASYGLTLRSVLPLVDVLIGTEEELAAALLPDPGTVMDGTDVDERQRRRTEEAVTRLIDDGVVGEVVVKRGPAGVTVRRPEATDEVPAFTVEVVNTVGAGDAFASGLIRSRLRGLDWHEAAAFAAACGAIEVTRHGCSRAFPTENEVLGFLVERGTGQPAV